MKKSEKLPTIVDTNIIVRFVTDDIPSDATKAEKYFFEAAKSSLFVPDPIVVEIVFVLAGSYSIPRAEISQKLTDLFSQEAFICDKHLIFESLVVFASSSFSFIDSYIIAQRRLGRVSGIYTFDKKLVSTVKKL